MGCCATRGWPPLWNTHTHMHMYQLLSLLLYYIILIQFYFYYVLFQWYDYYLIIFMQKIKFFISYRPVYEFWCIRLTCFCISLNCLVCLSLFGFDPPFLFCFFFVLFLAFVTQGLARYFSIGKTLPFFLCCKGLVLPFSSSVSLVCCLHSFVRLVLSYNVCLLEFFFSVIYIWFIYGLFIINIYYGY